MSTRSPIADLRHGLDSTSRPRIPPPESDVLRRPGHPLDAESRTLFEPRFKHDFSKVRVHADADAAAWASACTLTLLKSCLKRGSNRVRLSASSGWPGLRSTSDTGGGIPGREVESRPCRKSPIGERVLMVLALRL